MIKSKLIVFCFFANLAYSQSPITSKAPNSFVYDIELATRNNYGGLEIPVAKAYEMWANYEYLQSEDHSGAIPSGVQSASLFWEDLPGLIQSVSIISGSEPSTSKIKVTINKGKGKGNAVVALKVDGKIYWSWHIWVTDNPENGVVYDHGREMDAEGNPVAIQYMDRNLGATSGSFLDDQWQKTGGLMYEWGRKDPFPPLVYKDANFYQISGEVGVLSHRQVDPVNTIPVKIRPFNEIEKNIQYSVQNPLTYIVNTEAGGNWFSDQRYKVAAPSPDYVNWDLWSDNSKGLNANGNSSNTDLKNQSLSYELKSELDPCPSGWRVPSYYGRETQNNNLAFFGKKDWNNDDTSALRQLLPHDHNRSLTGVKVYPGLGMDFTNAQSGARNIGLISVSGGYVYYPNSVAPNAPVGVIFQDNAANGGLWSATLGYDGARIFSLISDPFSPKTNVGLHAVYNNITNPTKAGNAVKCMRDPNVAKIGDFPTPYFLSEEENYTIGLDQPNSYVVTTQTTVQIPVNKPFAVFNQHLSDQKMLPADQLMAKVNWTTNKNLVNSVSLQKNSGDPRNSKIIVDLVPGQKGNAVVSLHNGSFSNPAFWSWHIWVTDSDPTENAVTYLTEVPVATTYNFVNPTVSKLPPIKTVFMDRNLGAESSSLESGRANGLHYQWGRKDPLPVFEANQSHHIYTADLGSKSNPAESFRGQTINYREVNRDEYQNIFTASYEEYGTKESIKQKKAEANILFSIENPLFFLYQNGLGQLYNGGNHYSNDLSKVKDWVADERNSAENRWGHADKKSPFDPCPEGWRVPDVTLTNLYAGSKGNSPWYNSYKDDAYGRPGVIQDQWHDVASFYAGHVVGNHGWKFENEMFPIGNFPKAGIRGELGGNEISFDRSGVWTASLADHQTGYALAMQFQGNKMQTGTGVYPQAGMSVRCAKDESRLLRTPASDRNSGTLTEEGVVLPSNAGGVAIYPNPFKDYFTVDSKDAEAVEVFDVTGKLVISKKITNGSVSAEHLISGVYLVKILMKDQTSVTKKVIKH